MPGPTAVFNLVLFTEKPRMGLLSASLCGLGWPLTCSNCGHFAPPPTPTASSHGSQTGGCLSNLCPPQAVP